MSTSINIHSHFYNLNNMKINSGNIIKKTLKVKIGYLTLINWVKKTKLAKHFNNVTLICHYSPVHL